MALIASTGVNKYGFYRTYYNWAATTSTTTRTKDLVYAWLLVTYSQFLHSLTQAPNPDLDVKPRTELYGES